MNPRIYLVHFLTSQFLCEDGEQILSFQRLFRTRVEWGHRLVDHVSLDVVPLSWNLALGQEITLLFCCHKTKN